ncbi:LOW QUALITY PROTEIN: zinc finger protein 419-like [Phodopus roborovskii]|uniref:LOW QUALITY PROTEIN: zinc finger protein 419-like n=1 Tax=Phodopus roborovskii TaxID=109678 RepID=UPI0021E3F397|nr:LOW QUALITY PROTEIN: zinc finger protein 419-like [Phodopus roborovskii]
MSMDPAVQQSQTSVAGQGAQAQVPVSAKASADCKEGCVTFNDVAIYFLREEWTLLDGSQKRLYHHVMMEVFVLMSSLGLIPSGTHDITQLESSRAHFIPALRFLTPRVEVEKIRCEKNISSEEGLNVTTPQQQELSCAEKSLQRKENRIPVVKIKKCDLADKGFQSTDNVRDPQTPSGPLGHHATHSNTEPPRSTERKKAIHSKKRNFKCCDCGKSFSCKSLLIRHRRIHTGEKPFKCTECEKSFIQKADLNQHVKVHTGEKPYRCSECGKDFKHNRSLVGHQRLHTGERPYKCSQCGESYMNKSSLIRHNRLHTGEKPYKCSECGKLFKERSSLVYHARVHTGERPFKCSQCGKCFKKNSHLVKHRKVHSRGKPFKCNVCGRSFTMRFSLIRHQRFHTAAKHHECKDCGKVFCYRTGLSRHRKTHAERRIEWHEHGR